MNPTRSLPLKFWKRIRTLGYTPKETTLINLAMGSEPESVTTIPEPIASALNKAKEDQSLLLDFYAKWCVPCRKMEAEVLANAKVEEALKAITLVKVDTDTLPDVAKHFEIKALPTLIVLDSTGAIFMRHVGPITVEALVTHIEGLVKSQDLEEDR